MLKNTRFKEAVNDKRFNNHRQNPLQQKDGSLHFIYKDYKERVFVIYLFYIIYILPFGSLSIIL